MFGIQVIPRASPDVRKMQATMLRFYCGVPMSAGDRLRVMEFLRDRVDMARQVREHVVALRDIATALNEGSALMESDLSALCDCVLSGARRIECLLHEVVGLSMRGRGPDGGGKMAKGTMPWTLSTPS